MLKFNHWKKAKTLKRFSVRFLLLVTAALAVAIVIAIPIYKRSTAPVLTDQRSIIIKSNTRFPVVSMNVFFSGASRDRARFMFLHRQTKATNEIQLPKWFEPHQTDTGRPIRGRLPASFLVNGKTLYPQANSKLTVVHASDDEDPVVTKVPYSEYSALPWDDTEMLWEKLVDDAK